MIAGVPAEAQTREVKRSERRRLMAANGRAVRIVGSGETPDGLSQRATIWQRLALPAVVPPRLRSHVEREPQTRRMVGELLAVAYDLPSSPRPTRRAEEGPSW